jgi:RNA polymerase sigma-70 factor (ECF subfamily)
MAMAELPAVYRVAYHLAVNGPDAEDLVQETYLRALKAEATFRLGTVGIKPWLLKILHNVFLTRIKRGRLEPVASDFAHELAQETDGATTALWAQSLADLDWEQVDGRLKRAIEELPETYRTVFLLSSVEGLKYREIGEVLGTPIGTVMSRLFRARTMLLGQLGELGAELGHDSSRKPAPADETGR